MATIEPVVARRIRTQSDALEFELADGQVVRVPWERCSATLAKASSIQRSNAELSPSGYGIHWPLLDEDLSIGGLLRAIALESATAEPSPPPNLTCADFLEKITGNCCIGLFGYVI